MFDSLPRQWLPAAFSEDVKVGRAHAVDLADERVALFRDEGGRPAALLDRCPHRGVALSGGRVVQGTLECPFHGWRFAGDGRNCRVPLNPEAKRDRLGATALPTRELGQLVWVWTDPDTEPVGEPNVPEMLLDSGTQRRHKEAQWACHWTRAMENMLDAPHLPYVHRRTIGGGIRRQMEQAPAEVAMELRSTATDYGFQLTWAVGGEQLDGDHVWLRWRRPVGMTLNLGGPDGGGFAFRQHVFCVPGKRDHTRMLIASVTSMPWYLRLVPAFLNDAFEWRILGEDQGVVESSDPPEAPPPGDEFSVRTDAPTLTFRGWYWQQKRAGWPVGGAATAPPPTGAPPDAP